jgi:hypothetical protein
MGSPTAANVSFGKPKVSGGVWVAPIGTTVPTTATGALDPAFKNMGYITDAGLVNSVKSDTQEINAWGGDLVLKGQTKFGETFMVNLLETNAEALAVYYGSANVTVSGSNITVKQTSQQLPNVVVVFETLLTGGRVKRIVVPNGQIVDRSGDITYTDGDATAYPALFQAYPYDSVGTTHVEYIGLLGS